MALINLQSADFSNNPEISPQAQKQFANNHAGAEVEFAGCGKRLSNNPFTVWQSNSNGTRTMKLTQRVESTKLTP